MPNHLFTKHAQIRTGFISNFFLALFCSLALLIALGVAGLQLADSHSQFKNEDVLKVYCAASVVQPIEKSIESFQAITGTPVIIVRIGGSGELMGAVQAEMTTRSTQGADVLILADEVLSTRANELKVLTNTKVIATQSPVIGVHHSHPSDIKSLRDMLTTRFGIGSERTAIGQIAQRIAEEKKLVEQLERNKRTETENVMILAQAVASGNLESAILWRTVIDQVNSNHDSPQIKVATESVFPKKFDGQITVSLTAACENDEAISFLQFLSSSEEAGFAFEQFGFTRKGNAP